MWRNAELSSLKELSKTSENGGQSLNWLASYMHCNLLPCLVLCHASLKRSARHASPYEVHVLWHNLPSTCSLFQHMCTLELFLAICHVSHNQSGITCLILVWQSFLVCCLSLITCSLQVLQLSYNFEGLLGMSKQLMVQVQGLRWLQRNATK